MFFNWFKREKFPPYGSVKECRGCGATSFIRSYAQNDYTGEEYMRVICRNCACPTSEALKGELSHV